MKTMIRNLVVAAPLALASLSMAPMPAFAADPVIVLPPSEPDPAPTDIANPEPEPVQPQGPDEIAQPEPGPVQPDGPDEIAPKPKPAQPDGPDTLANPEPGPVVDPGNPTPDPVDPAQPPAAPTEQEPTADATHEPTVEPAQGGVDGADDFDAEVPAYEPVSAADGSDPVDLDHTVATEQQDARVWLALVSVVAALAGLVLLAWKLARRRA